MTSRATPDFEKRGIFDRHAAHNGTRGHRIEPTFTSRTESANENALPGSEPIVESPPVSRFKEIARQYDVRAISPREMVDLSVDLYVSGLLTREQYADLSFQPELLPNFEQTIGALTGERAEPDRPRDYTEIWRQRLAFETKHAHGDARVIARTQKILDLLNSFDRKERDGR